MMVGVGVDGAIVIRGDKLQLDKLIALIRDAVLYGESVDIVPTDDGAVTVRIFKDPVMF